MNLPLKFLLLMWAGWVTRAQQNAIDYLKEENRILREQVGNKRQTAAPHQLPEAAARRKGQGRRTKGPERACLHRHTPYAAGLAQRADRQEVRRQRTTQTRSPPEFARDPGPPRPDGERQSDLGLHPNRRCFV